MWVCVDIHVFNITQTLLVIFILFSMYMYVLIFMELGKSTCIFILESLFRIYIFLFYQGIKFLR